MGVDTIDHVNIRTADVVGTAQFFADVLGMDIQPSPGCADRNKAAWICDAAGQAVIHLAAVELLYPWEDSAALAASGSARIHHVALKCSGYEEMVQRLTAQQRVFHANDLPQIGLRQIFIEETNGIMLELNFFGA